MGPEWWHALRYSAALASEAGLEFAIASSAGWSETGGPWVQPQQAMKKLVWSETFVQGGTPWKGRLPRPPDTTGLFQNIPLSMWGTRRQQNRGLPRYYADVATIAYRAPTAEVPFASLKAAVTSSGGKIDGSVLCDGDLARTLSLAMGPHGRAWVEFSFPKAQRIQAVTVVIARPPSWDPLQGPGTGGWLESSVDRRAFRKVIDLPKSSALQGGALEQTVSFPPISAPVFRIVFEQPQERTIGEQLGVSAAPRTHQVAELVLHTAARVNRFEDKAGYSTRQIVDKDDTPTLSAADVVQKNDIVDLTGRMRADGSLDWTPPAGRWVVLRFGYSLTGRTNFPSPREGLGLEVDKLNRADVEMYMNSYLRRYAKGLGAEGIGPRGVRYMLTDSYEAGPQNWTDDMLEQFRLRRGYDARLWLPVFAGRAIESASASDRFLWDFRKTIGELMVEAHYGQISASLQQRGMGRYGEAHEHGRAFIGDGMAAKKGADIPMGAMWATSSLGVTPEEYDADIRESASVAHIYGKSLVAAESFSAYGNTYGFAPETLKPIADRELAMGVNRFVIHSSVHQPDSKPGPGIGLGPVGQWFTRKETWAEQAGSWLDYLTRSSYMLQQGRVIADIAYLYGEDTNVTALFNASPTPVPEGYQFDFVNADALVHELTIRGGRIVSRGGMEYRILALDPTTRRVSVPVLRKIRDLVRAGAVVVGTKPTRTPSLADDESEFHAIVAELWGATPGERSVGSGKVFADLSLATAMAAMQLAPDVTFTKPSAEELRFVHRALDDGDIYFISSGAARPQVLEASFRLTGRAPELWRADTGTIAPLSYRVKSGRTIVPLRFGPSDAAFVVFRKPNTAQSVSVKQPVREVPTVLEGPWEVSFPANLGAPAHARLDRLYSWTDSADPGIKYFSGTATYSKLATLDRDWRRGFSRVLLDLGSVKEVAEVLVNGRSVGVLWKPPFEIDVTDALKVGDNRIEISVTNLWPNRLIGDKQPGAHKIAFASFDPYEATSPLLPSGLLGPVTLSRVSDR